jgi:uncharacterized membrane protein (Fun14 family)
MFKTIFKYQRVSTVSILLYQINPTHCNSPNDDKNDNIIEKIKKKGMKEFHEFDSTALTKMIPEFDEKFMDNMNNNVVNFFESGLPGKIGYGFMMGYSSGFCLKKVSKVVAFCLGGVFITLQTLSFNGYIKLDYDKMKDVATDQLDLNNDGKIDIQDAKILFDKVNDIVGYNMPAGGGFTSGLIFGLRS